MTDNHYVMDYETLRYCFVAVFIHYKTDEKKVFVIHELQDDSKDFFEFITGNKVRGERHISFNGLAFDSQITETILRKGVEFLNMTVKEKIKLIYDKAQQLIHRASDWPEWPEWKLSIKQIDVFKMNHWDNPNRRCSLKWAQCSMDWKNVLDMPIHHDTPVNTREEIDTIITYCTNDVESTKHILMLSKPLVDVRGKVSKKYALNCFNYSNTKMGSELLLKLYCQYTGRERIEVKDYRTHRDQIALKDVIFPYIKFQSLDYMGFLEMLKNKVITNTKNDFKYELDFKGSTFTFALGGIHQCIKPGIYKSDETWIVNDLDVALCGATKIM